MLTVTGAVFFPHVAEDSGIAQHKSVFSRLPNDDAKKEFCCSQRCATYHCATNQTDDPVSLKQCSSVARPLYI